MHVNKSILGLKHETEGLQAEKEVSMSKKHYNSFHTRPQ